MTSTPRAPIDSIGGEYLVWIDIETTGLDPMRDLILEIACVITDFEFKELTDRRVFTIKPAGGLPELQPVVAQMHIENGLLGDLTNGNRLGDVDQALAALVCEYKGPICGASVHFDKSFIDRHMPLLSKCFNHRCFDTSTLKHAARMWGKPDEPKAESAHRALPDILGSIEDARKIRDWIWGGHFAVRGAQ